MAAIPEDLKADYQRAKAALEYGQCADPSRFEKEIRAIERIAVLTHAMESIVFRFDAADNGTLQVRDGVAWAMASDARTALFTTQVQPPK